MQILMLCYILVGGPVMPFDGGKLTCHMAIYIKVGLTPIRFMDLGNVCSLKAWVLWFFNSQQTEVLFYYLASSSSWMTKTTYVGCICIHNNGHKKWRGTSIRHNMDWIWATDRKTAAVRCSLVYWPFTELGRCGSINISKNIWMSVQRHTTTANFRSRLTIAQFLGKREQTPPHYRSLLLFLLINA